MSATLRMPSSGRKRTNASRKPNDLATSDHRDASDHRTSYRSDLSFFGETNCLRPVCSHRRCFPVRGRNSLFVFARFDTTIITMARCLRCWRLDNGTLAEKGLGISGRPIATGYDHRATCLTIHLFNTINPACCSQRPGRTLPHGAKSHMGRQRNFSGLWLLGLRVGIQSFWPARR
jgi:hypothetical protein